MDARLIHQAQSERLAASQAVATAMTKGASSTTKPSATSSLFKTNATGTTGTTSSSSSSAASGATITSSDFLTLLVSELKNQDPTQPTDPNAYITQLVGVNSLEQLISINSGIGTLDSALPTPTSGTTPITPAPGVTEPGVTNQVPGTPAL